MYTYVHLCTPMKTRLEIEKSTAKSYCNCLHPERFKRLFAWGTKGVHEMSYIMH